ncbi:MAG: amidohydrolase family protein [Alcanivoracaceae bacterium]
MRYDLIIANGRLFDGTSGDSFIADIAIKDGKVARISTEALDAEAEQTIDATGKWVTPGFIDLHSHVADGGGQACGYTSATEAVTRMGLDWTTSVRPVYFPAFDDPTKHLPASRYGVVARDDNNRPLASVSSDWTPTGRRSRTPTSSRPSTSR